MRIIKNKKGISPLIATVLIIGFTIVLAALVITWGTNLFKNAQQRTGESADLNLACTDVIGGLEFNINNLDKTAGTLDLTLNNGVKRDVSGFIFRIYNTGETAADTIDTDTLSGDYAVSGNGLKTFAMTYNVATVANPVKIGIKPKVVIKGLPQQCPGEATKELL